MSHAMLADPLAHFLLALAVVVFACHALGALAGRLGQPPIIGEIVAGLLLGPSLLGAVVPAGRAWVFTPDVVHGLDLAAQLGLVTFMFLLGSDLRLPTVRANSKVVTAVVAGAVGLPFLVGLGVAVLGHDSIAGSAGNRTAYVVFLALALSVTALPVLARILVDLKMDGGPLGTLALACAAVGDALAWGVLTVVLGLVSAGTTGNAGFVVAAALALVAVALGVRPVLAVAVRRAERNPAPGRILLPLLVAGAVGFAAATQMIGLHPVIGAFLFGVIVPRDSAALAHIRHELEGFTLVVLLPLFFAGIGLRTSIGLIGASTGHWLLFVGVLAAAVVTKLVGASGGARLAGLDRLDALRLGVLMNCRGVTELVIASIGWQYHLINDLGLTILALVALITTAGTFPAMRFIGGRHRVDTLAVPARAV